MKHQVKFLLIILNGLLPLLPTFGVVDMKAVHFLYLSIIQFLSILLYYKSYPKILVNNAIISSFLIFILFSGFSIFYSDYKMISLVEWSRYLTIFISFINIYALIGDDKRVVSFILVILTSLLCVESFYIFFNFLKNYLGNGLLQRSEIYEGFSFNLNITAFSLLIKVPFLQYYFYRQKNNYLKVLISIILGITFFDIFITSSRGAILTLIISLIIQASFLLILKKQEGIKSFRAVILVSICLFLGSLITQQYIYEKQESLKVTNRLSNSFINDSSTADRLEFYKHSLNSIIKAPFFGLGIGTWKLYGIKYNVNRMIDYQVPNDVHNDFLQIGAELGLIGLLFYSSIFIFAILYVLKIISNTSVDSNTKFFSTFLFISVLIYLFDANINFPRVRGISQLNFILIFSIVASYNKILIGGVKIWRNFKIYVLIILLPLIFYNIKLFQNSKEQSIPYYEYNFLRKLRSPIDKILKMDDFYNPINTVTVPIKLTKAFYLIENGSLDEAIKYTKSGRNQNPYLYMAESLLADIYLKKNNIDSALYYSKIAFDNLPLNSRHATIYQTALFKNDTIDIKRFDEIFSKIKNSKAGNKDEVWSNHLKALLKYRKYQDFSKDEKKLALEATKLYPERKDFKSIYNVMEYGLTRLGLSNNFSNEAETFFQNSDYQKAIEIWEKAAKILPLEEAYYLNIAQSYIALTKNDKALEYLNIIKDEKLIGNDGKYEFLMSLYNISIQNNLAACKFLKLSRLKGYVDSIPILNALKCSI